MAKTNPLSNTNSSLYINQLQVTVQGTSIDGRTRNKLHNRVLNPQDLLNYSSTPDNGCYDLQQPN